MWWLVLAGVVAVVLYEKNKPDAAHPKKTHPYADLFFKWGTSAVRPIEAQPGIFILGPIAPGSNGVPVDPVTHDPLAWFPQWYAAQSLARVPVWYKYSGNTDERGNQVAILYTTPAAIPFDAELVTQ